MPAVGAYSGVRGSKQAAAGVAGPGGVPALFLLLPMVPRITAAVVRGAWTQGPRYRP
jgi:hypothetical protein